AAAAAASAGINGRPRESPVGNDAKRRRLNNPGTIAMPTSNLARQSSLGPGTPKASTPGGSRQGSVGPRLPKKATTKRVAPHQMRKKILTGKKRPRPRGAARSGSTTGDDESAVSEADGSDDDGHSRMGADGTADDDVDMEEEDSDDTKYCTCQRVSFGNMICCDNDNCRYQWFHWQCVGLEHEPEGDWLCPDCRMLPKNKIKKSQG
ncbi:MAG: hypothetical protein INR71_09455, partial [Terriglobus roseus]|nr:hypothetical protein [Terriglobus roseus]